MNKQILKEWGENTAYAAKGHFKTADLKRMLIKSLVTINLLFAVFSILDFEFPMVAKIFGIASLIASILLLVYESQEDKNTVKKHMSVGDEYLKLHYELQELYYSTETNAEKFELVSGRIKKLINREKPIINQLAKFLAKRAIEKKGEMTKWWTNG